MPEWVQLLLGQGGALILLAFISRGGFKFFTSMISKQDAKYTEQEKRFNTLHESTLEHIHAHTDAVKRLSEQVLSCQGIHKVGQ